MSWFKNKIVLTEEEQLIEDIIIDMLKKPKVLIEVNPSALLSYMIIDEENSYFTEIDSIGVKITNHDFMLDKRMTTEVLDRMKNIIRDETIKRRVAKKEIIFQNGISLLKKIKEKLENGK